VLTYEFASIATAERYELDVRQKAWIELKQVGRHYQFSPGMSVAGLPFDLVQFQADFESQPWAFFEKLGE
jgi:hypothetical protein